MSNKGIRITIDGGCHTGKSILMQAFAELLIQAGIPAANITQLNDTQPEARLPGAAAISMLKQVAKSTTWEDTKFVFVERMVPRHSLSENDGDWSAMPDLSEHPLPDAPAFSLPRSQVAFEMTNQPSKESRIANSLLSMLKFAGVMAAVKNALPNGVAVPSDLQDWLKRAGVDMDFQHHPDLPPSRAPHHVVEFVSAMLKAGHADLLSKFKLTDFRKIEGKEVDKMNSLRKNFINRGTDREFHEVQYVAEFEAVEIVNFFALGGCPEFSQLVKAIHEVRPDVLARGAVIPAQGPKLQNSSLSGSHAPIGKLHDHDSSTPLFNKTAHATLTEACRAAQRSQYSPDLHSSNATKHAPDADLMAQGAPVSDMPGDGKSLGDSYSGTVLGHPHKPMRGECSSIYHLDDAPFIKLTPEESDRLQERLDNPPAPNEALKGAMEKFRESNLSKVADIGPNGAGFLPPSGE